MSREIFEGWTVQNFIDDLQPCLDLIQRGESWRKPLKTRKEIEAYTSDNQPYYKQVIPEVVNYFCLRYGI